MPRGTCKNNPDNFCYICGCVTTKAYKRKISYYVKKLIFIYLFIKQRPKSHYREVGAHRRQGKRKKGKTREKCEETERDRGTEGEIPNPIPSNCCAHGE